MIRHDNIRRARIVDIQHHDHRCRLGALVDQFKAARICMAFLARRHCRSQRFDDGRAQFGPATGCPDDDGWLISISMPMYAEGRNRPRGTE